MIGTAQTSALLDAATGDLVLRISGTSRAGQIVRLRSRRCTIGSDPTCTLRIRARGVGPVHCTVLRGVGKAVIQQGCSGTRLNGRPFESAPLVPGDHFSVGPLELEVLETGVSPVASPQQQAGPDGRRRIEESTRDSREQQCESLGSELARTQSRLTALEAELQARQADLEARAAEIDVRQKELETRQPDAGQQADEEELRRSTLDAREAEIRRLIGELEAQQVSFAAGAAAAAERERELDAREHQSEALRRELADTQSTLTALEAELQAREADLGARAAEIAARRKEFETRHADLEGRQADARKQAEEIEFRQSALDTRERECEILQRELAETQSKLTAMEADLQARQAELDAALRQLEADRRAFQEECQRWQQERSAADRLPQELQPDAVSPAESETSEPSSAAPIESVEILRRLGLAIPADDGAVDEPQTPSRNSPPSGSEFEPTTRNGESDRQRAAETADPHAPATLGEASVHRGRASSPLSGSAHHDEESIDQYMARLLDRMRGPGSPSPEPAIPTQAAEDDPGEASARADEPESATVQTEAPLRELTPRAVAPETSIDLSAMRELANLSANAAIARHARGRLVRASGGKLFVAVVGAICSGALYWQAIQLGTGPLTVYSSAVSLIVALYWSVQYLILTGRIIVAPAAQGVPMAASAKHDERVGIDPSPSRRPNVRPIASASDSPQTDPSGP